MYAKFKALSRTKKLLVAYGVISAVVALSTFTVNDGPKGPAMTADERAMQTKYRKIANCKVMNQECPEYEVVVVRKLN